MGEKRKEAEISWNVAEQENNKAQEGKGWK